MTEAPDTNLVGSTVYTRLSHRHHAHEPTTPKRVRPTKGARSRATAAQQDSPPLADGSQLVDDLAVHRERTDVGGPTSPQQVPEAVDQTVPMHDDLAGVIDLIRETYHRRRMYIRAQTSLTLQIYGSARRLVHSALPEDASLKKLNAAASELCKAIYNSGFSVREQVDHPQTAVFVAQTMPLNEARRMLQEHVKRLTKEMETLVQQTPLKQFADDRKGVGYVSCGMVLGEAGSLGNYARKEQIWKRMGLAVIDGERQRKCVDKVKAAMHGYNPIRRSAVWQLGDSLIKGDGPYRERYVVLKERERAKWEARGFTIIPAAEYKKVKGDKDAIRTVGHLHVHSKRLVEKELIRDMWRYWRASCAPVESHQDGQV